MSLTEFSAAKKRTRSCAVGNHPKREEIEDGLASRIPAAHISAWTHTDEGTPSVSHMTILRHLKKECGCESR